MSKYFDDDLKRDENNQAVLVCDRILTPPASTLTNSLYEQIALLAPEERRKILQTYREELPLFAP